MRFLIQRVTEGRVETEGRITGEVNRGFVVLAGFGVNDGKTLPGSRVWNGMLDKLLSLRVFPDDAGKMNLSLEDFGGGLLLVPQFTLYADCRKGRRPSFHLSADPATARLLFERCAADLLARLPGRVGLGVFGADMRVSLVNWGPVTILLDSEVLFPG